MSAEISGNSGLKIFKQISLLILAVFAGLWLASVSAVLVMRLGEWMGETVSGWLDERGRPRVMRRCVVFWAVVLIVIFIRRMGWRGIKDVGFSTDNPEWRPRSWWSLAAAGIVFGLIMIGTVTAFHMHIGVRRFVTDGIDVFSAGVIINVIMTGIVVSLLEETIFRGIFFRLAARTWNAAAAALIVSLLFALAHFIAPSAESFEGANFLSAGAGVFVSTLTMLSSAQFFWIRALNLTLLGIALSAFVVRTKTIWFGFGVHAAWIWAIKLNAHFTDTDWSSRLIPWFGMRGDFTDSTVATGILIFMIGLSFWRASPDGAVVWKKGVRWHVEPDVISTFNRWLERYFKPKIGFERKSCEEISEQGSFRILKEYKGCIVMALAGWIVKEYRPRSGWKGVRFAVMPSRGRRSFILARELAALDIPTPEAIAWAVKRRAGLAHVAYSITLEIRDAVPLTDWLANNSSDNNAVAGVMFAYGRLMALFHANRYSNRDFKHENVMCPVSSPESLSVVDLDGVSRKWRLTRRRAGKDLMRVGSSLAELGLCRETEVNAFFSSYNAMVPPRLRRNEFITSP